MKSKFLLGMLPFASFIILSFACASKPTIIAEDYIHSSDKDLLTGIKYVMSTSPDFFSESTFSVADRVNNEYTIKKVKTKLVYTQKVISTATGIPYNKNFYTFCHTDVTIKLSSANTLLFSYNNPQDIPADLVISGIINKENFLEHVSDVDIPDLFNTKLPVVMSDSSIYNNVYESLEKDPLFIFLTADNLTSIALKSYIKSLEEKKYTFELRVGEISENKSTEYGNYSYKISSYCEPNALGQSRIIYFLTNNDRLAYSKKGDKVICSGKIANIFINTVNEEMILIEK